MDITLIIIGIIAGMAILINPLIGLLATVALLHQSTIFQAVSRTLFGVFTMATPIKILGGITFISSFIRHIFERKKWDFLKKPQIKFFSLFLVWIFISGFTQPGFATRENFTVFTSAAILGFVILSLVNNLKRFRLVLWVSLISISIVCLNAIFSHFGLKETMRIIRIRGLGYGPNEFAIGLLPFLGIAFYNIFAEKKKILKILSLVITIFITLALIFTFSRAGLVGFLGMLLIATLKAKKKIKAILLLVMVSILLINTIPSYVWERFIKTRDVLENLDEVSKVDSTKRRYLLAKGAWQLFLDHPLFGVGVGNYYYKGRKYVGIHAGRAHTMYLEIMAELGIIGLVLFLGILFHTFKILKKIRGSNALMSGYAWGLYIGLVGFLIAAIFLHAQQEKGLWFVIFMSAALDRVAVGTKSNNTKNAVRRLNKGMIL